VKKLTLIGLSALLLVAFIGSSALAGAGCNASKAAAKTDGAGCQKMTQEECLKLYGITAEECKKMCADHENCGLTRMSVKGMTCGSCESQVTSALSKVDGVNKVIRVDHKEGYALICADPTKVDTKVLTAAVINTGYQAEIVPAVATTGSPVAAPQITTGKAGCGTSKTCAKTCSTKAKAACSGHKTDGTADKTAPKSDES
jgi:copper chaperone CopZ